MSLIQTGFLPVGEDEEGHSVRPRDRRRQKKVRGGTDSGQSVE